MSSLLQARQLMQAGNFQGARELVYGALRDDRYNVEAWQLAIQLAPHDDARAQAQVGLQRAMSARPAPAHYAQPYPQQPVVIHPGYGAMPYRLEKDYLGEAMITLALYFVGAWVVGFIANIVFMMNARRDRHNGVVTYNAGCLQAMLILNIAALILSCIGVGILFIVPILLALVSGGV